MVGLQFKQSPYIGININHAKELGQNIDYHYSRVRDLLALLRSAFEKKADLSAFCFILPIIIWEHRGTIIRYYFISPSKAAGLVCLEVTIVTSFQFNGQYLPPCSYYLV